MPGQALPPAWRQYREAFAVLQHMCTLGGREPGAGVPWAKVVSELGLSTRQGEDILSYLLTGGCVEYHQGQRQAALTVDGLEYVGHESRRRSIRPRQSGNASISQRRRASSASWAVSPFTQSRSLLPRS